ncbi:MAG: DUF523 domain-containing protein [Desulfuromonas sp.]|nr:MAG: DUF523 domain-containing protein [Desulfuromonas sp.]
MSEPILVSACLLGLRTRYDGTQRLHPEVTRFLETEGLLPIPVCPEQLAGLPTPRPSALFHSGDGDTLLDGNGELCDTSGNELNELFLQGAEQALSIARLTGCKRALLKERSPSCGCHQVYRAGNLVSGRGVTSALLQRNAIRVISEEELQPRSSKDHA